MPGKGRPFGKDNPSKGRPKGVPNKLSPTLKLLILEALDEAGGKDYLVELAKKHHSAFVSLVGRLLPIPIKDNASEPRMPMPPPIHEHHET